MSVADVAGVADVEEARFGVMGTRAHVVVVGGPPGLAAGAADRLERLEAMWSRFRPTSELSRLNALPARPVVVSPETYRVIALAVRGWHLTCGSFDPTVLPALIAAGYDRSFERIMKDAAAPGLPGVVPRQPGQDDQPRPALGCRGIELLPAVPAVVLPEGCTLDLGGIGKGFAADLLVGELRARGADGVCVNIGGDLRVDGRAPTDEGWIIGIDHPEDPGGAPLARLGLTSGAVATSTDRLRRWVSSGEERHHLIDPGRGCPARSDVAAASVVAGEGWLADVLAKACYLRPDMAPGFLAAARAAALLIDGAGRVVFLNGAEVYLR